MMDSDRGLTLPPFPSPYRASRLLLHFTSLPTRYGIGDVGPAGIEWIDLMEVIACKSVSLAKTD